MKGLLLAAILFITSTSPVQAMVHQQEISQDLTLISIETQTLLKRTAGLYSINISYEGTSVGVLKNFHMGASWRASLGLLVADELIDISTGRSNIIIGNRAVDLNQYLGIHAQIKFFEITPFASLAYQYHNRQNTMVFDFMTGLKLLKLDDSEMYFDRELGVIVESFPEISRALKQELLKDIQPYYLLPVIDFRFNYSFN